jgi:hypothetical protein
MSSSMRETNHMLLSGQFSNGSGSMSNTTPTNNNYRTHSVDPLDYKPSGNLAQLLQVKESDILNDEDNTSDTSSSQLTLNNNNSGSNSGGGGGNGYHRFTLQPKQQHPPLAKLRSPSTMSSASNNFSHGNRNTSNATNGNNNSGTNMFIKKRTASSTSSHSIYETQSPATAANNVPAHPPLHQQQSLPIHLPHQQYTGSNYMTLSNPYKPTLKTNPGNGGATYSSMNMNSSLDDLLMSNSNTSSSSVAHTRVKKMSQIENALASVLDDMKQLDFSTGLSNQQTDLASVTKNSITGGTTNGTHHTSSSLSLSASVKVKNNSIATKAAGGSGGPSLIRTNYANINSIKSTSSSLASSSGTKQRPDLVMDIPTNLLLSSPNQVNLIGGGGNGNHVGGKTNETAATIIGGFSTKSRRVSVDNGSGAGKEADSPGKSILSGTNSAPLPETTNGGVTTTSTTTTKILKVKEHLQSSSTTSTESSSDSSLTSSSSISINSAHNVSASKIKANNNSNSDLPMRLFNFDISAENGVVTTNTLANGNGHNESEEKSLKSPKLVHQQESYGKYGGKTELNSSGVIVKKQPPPLMKKPEKSDEILRKLGKSPPQLLQQQQQQQKQQQQLVESFNNILLNSASSISANSTNSSADGSNQVNHHDSSGGTTTINIDVNNKMSDTSGLESPDDGCGMSPSNCDSSKSNLSTRLSNSKATDV